MTETFEQMVLRIAMDAQIDHARKHGLRHAGSGLDEDTAEFIILFASNIRDELEKRAEPVAWMNSRNGFIAKENKNPEYNVGLYTCPPSAAARIAELDEELAAEKESCKLAHADALRQVEHLGRSEALISEFEAERDALRQEVERLKSSLTEWRSVFGHLGTADECGNEWNALISDRDALRMEVDALRREAGHIIAEQSRDITKVLRQQLAASQATNEKLREALSMHIHLVERNAPQLSGKAHGFAKQAIAIPNDTTALQSMIANAGEVMRERCIEVIDCEAIRALPAITLDDLKGGTA